MTRTSKREQSMGEVIQVLLNAGFRPDGETRTVEVRVPTQRSPLFGLSGGELAKFGGRQRFAQTGTNVKATVGLKTTAIYRVVGPGLQGVNGIATLDTGDVDSVRETIAQLAPGTEGVEINPR